MVTATEYLCKYPKYKEDFYVDNKKLFCRICSHVINIDRKSLIDDQLAMELLESLVIIRFLFRDIN